MSFALDALAKITRLGNSRIGKIALAGHACGRFAFLMLRSPEF